MDPSWYTTGTVTLKQSLLVLAFSLWLYWLWSRRNFYRFVFQLPGHFGLPILGILGRIHSPKDGIPLLRKLLDECKSNTIYIWLGLYPAVLTVDPDMVERIFSSNDFIDRSIQAASCIKGVTGNGLFSSSGEAWKRNRKLVNPSFNHKVLHSLLPVFNKGKNVLLLKLDSLSGTGEQKIARILQRASLGVTVETTMGKVLKDGDFVDEALAENYSFTLETVGLHILLSYLNLGSLIELYPRFKKAKKCVHNFVEELIISKLNSMAVSEADTRKEAEAEAEIKAENETLAIKKTPNIFIDHAIQLYQKQQFTWNDIISESNTLVFASFETTSITLFCAILMLAMHPEVQEKLYEEVVSAFPDKDFEVTYEHLEQLPYLERVINETMRIIPPVPVQQRNTTRHTQLTKDLVLPKDVNVMISAIHMHRRTDIWGPNAGKFDPDHFLPENLAKVHPYAFIPFAKGARNCIGWRYAILMLKVVLAGLVRNLRYTTTFKFEDLQYLGSISVKFVEEPGIQVHRRS